MKVCSADDVVFIRSVSGEGFDFQTRFGQFSEIMEKLIGTFSAKPVGIEGFEDFAFGQEIHLAVRSSLNEGLGGVGQKRGIASAVRAGPLAARRVKMAGEVVPGETVKLAQEFL